MSAIMIKQYFPNSRNCSLNILLKTRLNLKGSYRILSWAAWIWIIRLEKNYWHGRSSDSIRYRQSTIAAASGQTGFGGN